MVAGSSRANTSLDFSFGNGGAVTTSFGSGGDQATGVAIDASGNIVVGGFSFQATVDFALARYDQSGTLDPTFGNSGKVLTDLGASDFAEAIAIDHGGRIVLAGGTGVNTGTDFALGVALTDPVMDSLVSFATTAGTCSVAKSKGNATLNCSLGGWRTGRRRRSRSW